MIYYSILAGGTGFIYFVFSPWDFPYSTSLWSECRTLALEALDLSAGLLSGIPHIKVKDINNVSTSRLAIPSSSGNHGQPKCYSSSIHKSAQYI